MSEDHLERTVLERVSTDRRGFIKKLVVGSAFAIPVVASFEMFGSSTTADGVTCTSPNGGSGTSGSGTTGGAGGTRQRGANQGTCGGTPDGGTGGAPNPQFSSDRAIKTDVLPVVWA